MLKKLKEVVSGKNSKEAEKKVIPNREPQKTFGGRTQAQIQQELKGESQGHYFLAKPHISESAQISLEETSGGKKDPVNRIGTTSSSLSEEIATLYSEGEQKSAIKLITDHLNENQGNVDKRYWYMLMDSYQATDNRASFEKVALAFSQKFETSSPSWFSNTTEVKNTMMAGKNIIILEPTFKMTQALKFKEFLKASKEEKFCRINVSQCKFEQSEPEALRALYKLFKDLRKYDIKSVLMGDNNLINFCKSYINPNLDNKTLQPQFLEMEDLFWLIYLEILQWKGRHDDFENLALDYAIKFEVSPPGWEEDGVMKIELSYEDKTSDNQHIDKVLSSNNIDSVLEMIKDSYEKSDKCEIDFSEVERIDFSSAGSISFFIQNLWNEDEKNQKKVIIKQPNEMIIILLEMVGATEFLEIIPRKR